MSEFGRLRPLARAAWDVAADVWTVTRARRAAARGGAPRVFYGYRNLAARVASGCGGLVKTMELSADFPNRPRGFNLLYLVSSAAPWRAAAMTRGARERGARLIWNQNGVAFPAWHGDGWEGANAIMRELIRQADYVFYQSEFCRAAADRFLGPIAAPWEVLHNAVDTDRFAPAARQGRDKTLRLLAAGSHWQAYRVKSAVETLGIVRKSGLDAELIVAGRFLWTDQAAARREMAAWCRESGVERAVRIRGPYTQAEAPGLLRSADILLHPKCNDPCPTLVLEAMSSGLPVVYSASGGTPELVGPDAGIGVASAVSWDRHVPPESADMAAAAVKIAGDIKRCSAAARSRAVARFDIRAWRARHGEVFCRMAAN